MISRKTCAERAIARQIDATQAPPENSSQSEQSVNKKRVRGRSCQETLRV
jgi:hypothetical protein